MLVQMQRSELLQNHGSAKQIAGRQRSLGGCRWASETRPEKHDLNIFFVTREIESKRRRMECTFQHLLCTRNG